jgi:signal transduction histidine kinase
MFKMKGCIWFFLTINGAFLVPNQSFAQDKQQIDSLIQETRIVFDLANQENDLALTKSRDLLNYAISIKDDVAIANAMNSLGWSFFHGSKQDSSLHYLEKSRLLFKKSKKFKEVAQVSLNISEVYIRNSHYKKALEHLMEADKVNNKLKIEPIQSDLYRQFGIVYRELQSYELSTNYFSKALEGFKKQNDTYRYITTGTSLSILYRKLKLQNKAILLLKELETEHKKAGLSSYLLAMIYENLGESNYEIKNYNEARDYFKKAYDIFLELNLKADLAYESMNIGKTLFQLKDIKNAEIYLLKSFKINDSLQLLNYSYEASSELSKLYQFQGKWNKAFDYSHIALILKDSLNHRQQLSSAEKLARKFELDKREQEIELLKAKNELVESNRKKNKFLLYLFSSLFVFTSIISWLFWNRIQLNKKLQLEIKKNKIAGDIEDERVLNQFAVSLFGKNTIEDIFWDIAYNCIEFLSFKDCVVYKANIQAQQLIQMAAAGPKNPQNDNKIFNPIVIPFDKGIVGSVYKNAKAEIVNDTTLDKRYVQDDEVRLSEITVPIFVDGRVFGIIDSEHPQKNFYTERHLNILERIASICSERINKLLTEEKLRLSIARDLHDEVGSTVTSINILSGLLLHNQNEKKQEYLEKINEQSQNIMENMSDIIWSINPNHDTLDQTILKMKEFAIEHIELSGMHCDFDIQLFGNQRSIFPEERKYIYMIFKEAINNIIKHSKASLVKIKINLTDENFNIEIEDNGLGYNQNTIKIGNGIQNMQERAKAINAKFSIQTGIKNGTKIFFSKSLSHH